jgi:uncharacterized membrane protein YphA (DoxX/SURF4 family)
MMHRLLILVWFIAAGFTQLAAMRGLQAWSNKLPQPSAQFGRRKFNWQHAALTAALMTCVFHGIVTAHSTGS